MKRRKGTGYKRNADAAQLAVLGLVGAGSAVAMGRGYLAERRTRALDRELLLALAPYRLAPDTRLSPPSGGVQDAPRLRDLADLDALTFEHDPRKRELIAQVRAGDIHLGHDRRGVPYLSRPGQPPVEVEFSRAFERRKHNGVSALATLADLREGRVVPTDDEIEQGAEYAPDSTVRAWLRQERGRRLAEAYGIASRTPREDVPVMLRSTAERYRRGLETRRYLTEALAERSRGLGVDPPDDFGTEVEFIPRDEITRDKVAWAFRLGDVIFAAIGAEDYRRGTATADARGGLSLVLFDRREFSSYGFMRHEEMWDIYHELKEGLRDLDGMPLSYASIGDAMADMRHLSREMRRDLYHGPTNVVRYGKRLRPTPGAVAAAGRSFVSFRLPPWLNGSPYHAVVFGAKKDAVASGWHPDMVVLVESRMGQLLWVVRRFDAVLAREGFWVSSIHDPRVYPDEVRAATASEMRR